MEAFATPVEQITTSNNTLTSLYYEDKIIHQMMNIKDDKGSELINMSKEHFHLSIPVIGGPNRIIRLEPVLDTLTMESLEKMLVIATDLLSDPNTRYITGLRIHFGFFGDKIKLLYQPVIMEWEKFDGITLDDMYKVVEKKDAQGKPVYYNELALDVNEATASSYKNDYKAYIRIKHNLDVLEQHTAHTPKDIDSIIVTFQAIFSLMEKENSEKLFLHNSVRKLKENPSDSVRHSILMSATKVILAPDSNSQFSNRSHLCPPCGSTVGFDIAE